MHFKLGQKFIDIIRGKYLIFSKDIKLAKDKLNEIKNNGTIKHQSEVQKEIWDSFVNESSMGWAYFLYDVIAIDRFAKYKNESFAIYDTNNNEIQMLVQLHLTPDNRLTSRWGYVLKDNLTKKQRRKVKENFENYIDSYMTANQIKSFSINLAPLSEAMNPTNVTTINPLMEFNFEPSIRYTYIVNLSKSDDRLLADCEETTRQAVRKIFNSDKYQIEKAQSNEEDFKKYVQLHKETYTRTNSISIIIDDNYHRNMFFNLLPKGICDIYFLKDKSINEFIASVAILIYKNSAYYWWGSSKNKKEVGINKFLLYEAIKETRLKFNRYGYFETGGGYPYMRLGKVKGISDYKKCFGTFLHPIYTGRYIVKKEKI